MNEIENDAFLRSHLFLNKPEKNKLSVGGYIVTKEENDVYNVYKKNLSNLLYENLYSFDAAMAIAESLNANKAGRIKDILEAEEEYVDRYNDMMSFKYHYKLAKENKTGNEWIYEDRYIVASQRAKKALEGVRRFRIARKS